LNAALQIQFGQSNESLKQNILCKVIVLWVTTSIYSKKNAPISQFKKCNHLKIQMNQIFTDLGEANISSQKQDLIRVCIWIWVNH
jgi:hypothetical protein